MQRLCVAFSIILAGLALCAQGAWAQAELYSNDFAGSAGRPPTSEFRIVGAIGDAYWQVTDGALESGDGDTFPLGSTWAFVSRAGAQSWRDYRVSVDVLATDDDGGSVGLAARWESSQRFYAVEITTTDLSTRVELLRYYDGAPVLLAGATDPGDVSVPAMGSIQGQTQPVEVALVVSGNRLSVEIDGQELLSANDSRIPTGSVAVGQAYNAVRFDNLTVSAVGGGLAVADEFRVEVLRNSSLARAEEVVARLAGLDNVDVIPIASGGYGVYSGRFSTTAAAETHRTLIAQQFNLRPEGVVIAGAIESTGAARPAGDLGGYRVIVAEVPDAQDAQRLSADLRALGFEGVEVFRGESGALVLAGSRFSTPMQAQSLIDRLIANGFALAEVRSVDDIEGSVVRAAQATPRSSPASTPTATPAATPTPAAAATTPVIQPPAPSSGGGSLIQIIIGVVVGVAVIGAVVWFVLKKKSESAPAPAAAPSKGLGATGQRSTSASSLTGLTPPPSRAAKPKSESKPSAEKPKEQSPAPAKKKAADLRPVQDTARIKPGSFAPAPGEEEAEEQKQQTEGIKLDVTDSPGPAAAKGGDIASALDAAFEGGDAQSGDEQTDAGLKLDFLMGDDDQRDPGTTGASPSSAPGSASPVGQDHEYYYEQDFESDEAGTHPAKWNGEYEYASLKVIDEQAPGGSSKCMRFEKQEGVGSAYYSCRFPDAQGRVVVEFDLRCDDKNKYLLGFYIEKDGDFRQSIATVVHRTNSRAEPTLRIINEPAPYEFGSWRHVRIEVDLTRAVLDCSLDDELVMTGHRVQNCPKVVNTLSIRDNLATTGVLLIGNIKIYPAP